MHCPLYIQLVLKTLMGRAVQKPAVQTNPATASLDSVFPVVMLAIKEADVMLVSKTRLV